MTFLMLAEGICICIACESLTLPLGGERFCISVLLGVWLSFVFPCALARVLTGPEGPQ